MVEVSKKLHRIGDKDPDIQNLHSYLKRFGYMKLDKKELNVFG